MILASSRQIKEKLEYQMIQRPFIHYIMYRNPSICQTKTRGAKNNIIITVYAADHHYDAGLVFLKVSVGYHFSVARRVVEKKRT